MQKCLKCQNKFKYKELLKQQCDFKNHNSNSLICSKCNTEHRISKFTIIITSILLFAPSYIFSYYFSIFGFNRLLIFFSWILFIVFLIPLYSRYHIKTEKTNIGGN